MKRKQLLGFSAFMLTAAMFTACTAEADTAAEEPDKEVEVQEMDSISIGLMQIGGAVPVEYGIAEGIFEKHGLEVDYAFTRGGSVMVPAVQTGEYDFANTNPLTIMQANDAGLDMRILTGFAYAYPEGEDTNAVVTRKDAGIEDFGDLAGRDVAINTLETQGDLSIMEATERGGGEAADIRFSEIAFPEMEPQLDLGNVDAIWLPEPLLSKALANPDNSIVGYSTQESVPGMPMLSTFTSAKYATENPEIVEKFIAAMDEVLTEAAANEPDVREFLPEFMGVPVEAIEHMKLEEWSSETREDLVNDIGELAVKFDFIEAIPENLYLDE